MDPIRKMGLTAGFSIVLMAGVLEAAAEVKANESHAASPATEQNGSLRTRVGTATYYGKGFDGKKTASGEVFDKDEMVAAHPSYPVGTRARVTNLANGRSQIVRIIDRGPASQHQDEGVIVDVSEGVATKLGFLRKGKTRVRLEVLEWGEKREEARVGSLR